MMHGQADNEIYLLIKYIKSVLWRVAKCLSYIEEARCLKVNMSTKWSKGEKCFQWHINVFWCALEFALRDDLQ